jgi:hypothetical protein
MVSQLRFLDTCLGWWWGWPDNFISGDDAVVEGTLLHYVCLWQMERAGGDGGWISTGGSLHVYRCGGEFKKKCSLYNLWSFDVNGDVRQVRCFDVMFPIEILSYL